MAGAPYVCRWVLPQLHATSPCPLPAGCLPRSPAATPPPSKQAVFPLAAVAVKALLCQVCLACFGAMHPGWQCSPRSWAVGVFMHSVVHISGAPCCPAPPYRRACLLPLLHNRCIRSRGRPKRCPTRWWCLELRGSSRQPG